MNCLLSLNSQELVKEFVMKDEVWRDWLASALVWDGQNIPPRGRRISASGGYEHGGDVGSSGASAPEESRGRGTVGDKGRATIMAWEPIVGAWGVDSLCSPRTPRSSHIGLAVGQSLDGPDGNVGRSHIISSRKRLRVLRSPTSTGSHNTNSVDVDGRKRWDIPLFPDLNNPEIIPAGSSDEDSSRDLMQEDGVARTSVGSVVLETTGSPENIEEEVADTIDIGVKNWGSRKGPAWQDMGLDNLWIGSGFGRRKIRGAPNSDSEVVELSRLQASLSAYNWSPARDRWKWGLEDSGEFSVSSIKFITNFIKTLRNFVAGW
ncbi:hypothetical protein L1987_84142 [Smallanthus sonchifolius]|uniref:Uncharacterized protein n=1 Tax=Smallanthus sonchifolius TaxID=185202 RepID=A0ACB8YEJ5_9ASTR|nr:hypothetical protein L1987_84142 [Smallanthus sonchifolius]